MQARAAEDLKKLVTDKLVAAGLIYEGAKAFATPRRLALAVQGIPARQPDVKEERKGPRVGAPEQAHRGLSQGAGLTSIDQAKVQPDKKGDFYVAVIEKPGRPAIDVIAEIVPEVAKRFPGRSRCAGARRRPSPARSTGCGRCIPSSRRSGRRPRSPTSCRSRSTASQSGDTTYGHRFLAPDADQGEAASTTTWPSSTRPRSCSIRRAARRSSSPTPRPSLSRRASSWSRTRAAGRGRGPGRMAGGADGRVRRGVPRDPRGGDPRHHPHQPEMLRGARSEDRRSSPTSSSWSSNIEASDGGKAIVAGNERVIRARLSDAKFFYETDLKTRLEDRLPKFEHIVFHEKLGTQAERIARIVALAGQLAPIVGADVAKAERAAQLCKADLADRSGRRIPRAAGPDGPLLRRGAGRGRSRRPRHRGSLQAEGPGRSACRPIRCRSRSRSPTRSTC